MLSRRLKSSKDDPLGNTEQAIEAAHQKFKGQSHKNVEKFTPPPKKKKKKLNIFLRGERTKLFGMVLRQISSFYFI